MSAATAEPQAGELLVNGKPVRLRLVQTVIWGAVAAALGSALIAGIYFGVFQVRWYVHVASVHFQIFYLKHWFDSGMGVFNRYKSWVLYRHGERDLLEPAMATMFVKTLLAKPKWWGIRCGRFRLIATPVLLVALAVGLAAGGVWLLDFGLPNAWHALKLGTVTAPSWISHSSWQVILLGIVIGLVLHRLWAPVGATIQGFIVDRSVDRFKVSSRSNPPVWTRAPISPPVLRERWWQMKEHDISVRVRDQASKWLITVLIFVCTILILLGLLAQHWIGLGHSVPYLAPR